MKTGAAGSIIKGVIKFYKQWRAFRKKDDRNSRNFLIVQYLPLARYVASTIPVFNTRLYSYEDLVSWATLGLIDAVAKFDPDRGVKFETYAIARIKGEVKDNIRRAARTVNVKKKRIYDRAYEKLCQKLSRPPGAREMMAELGVNHRQYKSWLACSLSVSIISLDEFLGVEAKDSAYQNYLEKEEEFLQAAELRERKEALALVIAGLPERERRIITLYYYEGLTLDEIGEILHLTKGRVSQIHAHAVLYIRKLVEQSLNRSGGSADTYNGRRK